jgi:hypothetical protein
MTRKNAIKILIRQKDKLADYTIYKDETWTFQTASFIKDFFGEQSPEFSFISQFKFTVFGHTGMTNEMWRNELDLKQNKALKFIEDCIETIQHKGLYKTPKINFLQNLGSNAVWAIISISVPGLLTIGFIFGQFISDTKNFELKQHVKQLQDSLYFRPTFVIPDNKSNNDTNKTINN